MTKTSSASAASIAVAPAGKRPAKYAETDVITVTEKGKTNPKRAASAARYAIYLQARKEPLTVGAYLDACKALQPDEERYRWRADLSWDVARGYIEISPKK